MTKKQKQPFSEEIVLKMWSEKLGRDIEKKVKLTPIEQFEKENPGKHAIWHGKVTKQFQNWLEAKKNE